MKLRLATSLTTALVLVVLLFVAVGAQVKQPAEWITAKRLTVATRADIGTTLTAATVNATTLTATTLNATTAAVSGSATATGLQINGSGNITGHLDVLDYASVSGKFYLIPPATQTITNGGAIAVTGGVVEVTAAGEVTAELGTAGDGQVLILVNVGSNPINIADTGTTKLAGALALGADDTVMFVGAGVSWYEVNRSAN